MEKHVYNSWKSVLLALVLVVLLVPSASALTLSSIEGSWSNVIGSDYIFYEHDVAIGYGNNLEDRVRWGEGPGEGPDKGPPSGLGFTGVGTPLMFDVGDVFEIGQLRHFNNPILGGTAAESANLTISLAFSDPGGLAGMFDFTFAIDETPNVTGDPILDADFIDFPDSYATETFDINGRAHTLQLLGFGYSPDNLIQQFTSPELATNSTLLWGKIITLSDPVIPEPGTILLLSAGLIGLAGLKKKFYKK